MDRSNIQTQRVVEELVRREVIHNLCQTVGFVEEHDPDQIVYDSIDWQEAAEAQGWELTNEGVFRKKDDDFDDDEASLQAGYQLPDWKADYRDDPTGDKDENELIFFVGPEGKVFNPTDPQNPWTELLMHALADPRDVGYLLENDDSWEDLCQNQGIDADDYRKDVYEYWAVTSYMGEKLAAEGEIVFDLLDFTVWGRCCTGQAISMDCVFFKIAKDMEILPGQKYEWKL